MLNWVPRRVRSGGRACRRERLRCLGRRHTDAATRRLRDLLGGGHASREDQVELFGGRELRRGLCAHETEVHRALHHTLSGDALAIVAHAELQPVVVGAAFGERPDPVADRLASQGLEALCEDGAGLVEAARARHALF